MNGSIKKETFTLKLAREIGKPDKNNVLISEEIWINSLNGYIKELIEKNSFFITLGKEEPFHVDLLKAVARIKEINDKYAVIELIKNSNSIKNLIETIGIDNLRLNFNTYFKYEEKSNLKVVTELKLGTFYIDYMNGGPSQKIRGDV